MSGPNWPGASTCRRPDLCPLRGGGGRASGRLLSHLPFTGEAPGPLPRCSPESSFLHCCKWRLSGSMNSLASAPQPRACAARTHPALHAARGLHENPNWKVTLQTAPGCEKRLETGAGGGEMPCTKRGIFLPGKVTHHSADPGYAALAAGLRPARCCAAFECRKSNASYRVNSVNFGGIQGRNRLDRIAALAKMRASGNGPRR